MNDTTGARLWTVSQMLKDVRFGAKMTSPQQHLCMAVGTKMGGGAKGAIALLMFLADTLTLLALGFARCFNITVVKSILA